jgi:hypothetical protein
VKAASRVNALFLIGRCGSLKDAHVSRPDSRVTVTGRNTIAAQESQLIGSIDLGYDRSRRQSRYAAP